MNGMLDNSDESKDRLTLNLKSVQNWGSSLIELNIDDRTDDGDDLAGNLALSNARYRSGQHLKIHLLVFSFFKSGRIFWHRRIS